MESYWIQTSTFLMIHSEADRPFMMHEGLF